MLAGWIAVLTGQTAEAQRWAAIVDAASFDLVPADGSASFDSARAMLRALMCAAGPEQMAADASLAVAQEPPWSPWRDTALCLCAEAHLLSGDVDRAGALFAESSAAAAAMNSPDCARRQRVRARRAGDGSRAMGGGGRARRAALAVVDEAPDAGLRYERARLRRRGPASVHRGDMEGANRQLTRAMRVRPTPDVRASRTSPCGCDCNWPRCTGRMADQTAARHLLREIDDIVLHRPDLGALGDEVSEFRRIVTSNAQGGPAGGSPLSPAELRLLPYLQTHLTIREIGERLFVSRNTVSSQVTSIYRKLGVSSRNDAVTQATTIGLLGG